MQWRLSILLALVCTFCSMAVASSKSSVSPDDYLDTAMDLIRNNALYSSRVDWDHVRTEAHRRSQDAATSAATYPAIRYVLSELDDHHSFLQLDDAHRAAERAALAGKQERGQARSKPERTISTAYQGRKPEFEKLPAAGDRVLAYMVMPGTTPGRRDDAFSTDYQDHLRTLRAASPCGWIVDLRGNDGGNVWPMIAGLGPLLGNGMVAGSVDNRGGLSAYIYRDGQAVYRDADGKETVAGKVDAPMPVIEPMPPIAVLIDSLTASSGEIMAIALQGRAAPTRYFGERTYGASTVTEGHLLPDGANLVIAMGVDTNRHGHRYPDGIKPDVAIPDAKERPPLSGDPAVQAASDWLSARTACNA